MKGGHIAIITTQGGENNVMQRIKYLNHITIIAIWREVMPIMQREATTTTWKEATIAMQRETTTTWKKATIATQWEIALTWKGAIVAWRETTTNISIMCEEKQATKKNKCKKT